MPVSMPVLSLCLAFGAAAPYVTLLHLRPAADVSYTHHTIKDASYRSLFLTSQLPCRLVKQGCDECSFRWGISKEANETTVGKKEAHINRSMVTCEGSTRH